MWRNEPAKNIMTQKSTIRAVGSSALVRAVGVTYDDHPRYEVTMNDVVIGHVEGNNPTAGAPGGELLPERTERRQRGEKLNQIPR